MKIREYIQVKPYTGGGGGGGENPDPAVYCPANGYIPDPSIYTPPAIPLPESNPESIIFICNAKYEQWNGISFAKSGTSKYKIEIFNEDGILLSTATDNNNSFSISKPYETGYYTVKVSFETAGTTFLNVRTTFTIQNFFVENVIFNTPNLNSLHNAFQYHAGLKSVDFNCTLDYLASFYGAFQYTSLTSFTFQQSYPQLTTVENMFYGAETRQIVFPWDCYLPLLSSMQRMAIAVAGFGGKLRKLHFPQNMPAVTNMLQILANQYEFYDLRLWENAPNITDLGHFLSLTAYKEETLIMPPLPSVTSLFGSFRGIKTKILKFTGPSNNLSGLQNMLSEMFYLEEIEFPRSWQATMYTPFATHNFLKKIRQPDVLLLPVTNYPLIPIHASPLLEEITGDADNSAMSTTTPMSLPSLSPKLKIANLPKLRVSSFIANLIRYENLTVLDWDMENSDYSSTTAPQIRINAPFNASWLNTMFTRLPIVSGKIMDIGRCDGYQESDLSIVIAKGWIVRGPCKIGNGYVDTITKTTAVFRGNMLHLGSYASVTAGICFATTPNPTTANLTRSATVSSLGDFSVNINSGLSANTTYYARAYASNSYTSTVYGAQFIFTTLP